MKIEFENDEEKKATIMTLGLLADLCNAGREMKYPMGLLAMLPMMILVRTQLRAIGFDRETIEKVFTAKGANSICSILGVGVAQDKDSKFDFSTIEPLNKPRV